MPLPASMPHGSGVMHRASAPCSTRQEQVMHRASVSSQRRVDLVMHRASAPCLTRQGRAMHGASPVLQVLTHRVMHGASLPRSINPERVSRHGRFLACPEISPSRRRPSWA